MFDNYSLETFYDEMFANHVKPRDHYQCLYQQISCFSMKELRSRQELAQSSFLRRGITFTVYSDQQGTERAMPFDLIPRIIPLKEWQFLEEGLKQRVKALNMFLEDVYNDQEILHEGIVPRDLIVSSPYFYTQVAKIKVPQQNHIFMSGIDLIRDNKGEYRILEDNLRNPSGLSYVYQNRNVMRRVFPELFQSYSISTLEQQFQNMLYALQYISPSSKSNPTVVLLTPGIYNAAYYDHSFLAQQMGIPLVESSDLLVTERKVFMKTIRGLKQVDVIYRRIDDDFLDPLEFREDSLLGLPGLTDCYRAGNVSIANGIGNGIADDKAVYAYVPAMIEYYLGEKPMIKNVDTYLLNDNEQREYVLENIDKLVVKKTDGSGGYGMLVGPHASEEERKTFRHKIKCNPGAYIAQPTIQLSRTPTLIGDQFKGCHVDLRAYVVQGEEISVIPSGLSRVALKEGSLVVNSSQGGGGKDTWVLEI